MASRALVILSGGPDSTAAALWALDNGYQVDLITFQVRGDAQYGEIFAAMRVAAALDLPHKIIDLKSAIGAFTPNMHIMRHAGVKPLGVDKSQPYLMPFGTGTLLSFAASYAIHEGVSTLVWGATADDGEANWEYSQEFCDHLAALINRVTGTSLKIVAPFSSKHKPQVLASFAQHLGLFAQTWSCRTASNIQCGQCEGCIARRLSAQLAAITDQTAYTSLAIKPLPAELARKAIDTFTDSDWKTLGDFAGIYCSDRGDW